MLKKIFIISFIVGITVSTFAQHQRGTLSMKDTITDNDIVVPEDMVRNFDQLLVDWKSGLNSGAVCDSYGRDNILYPDSSYINRLYSLPTEMELVYNPIVRSYIDMYTGRMRNSVGYFLGKADYYFPIFEQALDKAGLPLELKYLPIIESALNPTIVSRAGATGLWQFMIGTGRVYNLEINSLVDERRDPLKSTEAAVRYLKDLYDIYGNWNLVIAAYNCGPGNVNKAIRRSGGKTDYWEIYQYLPRETRGYVPAFIAATYVMNYYSLHNICPNEYEYHQSTDTIVVDRYMHLQQLSDVLNVSIDDIRTLNPQFKKDIVPGEFKQYTLKLPSTQAVDFEVYKNNVYAYRSAEFLSHRKVVEPSGVDAVSGTGRVRHKVRRGETLSVIASKHKVTVSQIKKWNKLRSNNLRVGQMLTIHKPVRKAAKQTTYLADNNSNTQQNTSTSASVSTRQSDSGGGSNTLSEYFSRQSSSNTADVVDSADESEESASADEEAHSTPPETQTIYHKVRIGETVTQIAAKYNVLPNNIVEWNNIETMPRVGERLIIHLPQKTEPQPQQQSNADLLADNNTSSSVDPGFEQYRESRPVRVNTTSPTIKTSEIVVAKTQPEKKQTAKKKQTTYTVKKGDTLGHIVEKFGKGLTVSEIKSANKLRSDKLKIGQKLKIPR